MQRISFVATLFTALILTVSINLQAQENTSNQFNGPLILEDFEGWLFNDEPKPVDGVTPVEPQPQPPLIYNGPKNENEIVMQPAEVTATSFMLLEPNYDFGVVKTGETIRHTFKITNTGSIPLIFYSAKGSCGCTVPQLPKAPVLPGETGELFVEFNTSGKVGKQLKTVTVTANTTPSTIRLSMSGALTNK